MTAEWFPSGLSADDLFPLAARVAGIALLVTGAELTAALPGLARWRRPDAAAGPRWVLAHRMTALLLALLGGWFIVDPRACLSGGGLAAVLILGYLMVALQPLGDGADIMLMIVLAGLGVLWLVPSTALTDWAAWLVALNVCLAYLWSGVAKLRVPAWRHGRQVALAVNSPRFGSAQVAWHMLNRPTITRLTAWSVILLEVSCPIFLILGGWPLIAWMVCAILMHVSVAIIMGLGRFLWSFGAGLFAMAGARLLV